MAPLPGLKRGESKMKQARGEGHNTYLWWRAISPKVRRLWVTRIGPMQLAQKWTSLGVVMLQPVEGMS